MEDQCNGHVYTSDIYITWMFHDDIVAVEAVKSDRRAGHIDNMKMFIRIKRRAAGQAKQLFVILR